MKKTVSKLKKELDKWFSLYIRLREANEYGMCQCFTCGNSQVIIKKTVCKTDTFKVGNICLLDLMRRIVRFSALSAMSMLGVNSINFQLALDGKYGEGKAEELQYLARTTLKISRVEYEEKISYYKSLVDKLKKEKGIE